MHIREIDFPNSFFAMSSTNMEGPGNKNFECDACDYVTKHRRDLVNHRRKHTGEKPFKCSVCDKAFSTQSNRKKHEVTHTGEKPYECDLCSVKFTERGSLKKHMRIHTGDARFMCNHCGKNYTQNSHLQVHLRTHSGEKPFKCSSCDRRFTRNEDCKMHEFVHHKNESMSCSVCKKTFAHERYLRRHSHIHTNTCPYVCSICERKFTKSTSLKYHMRIHTQERPFECTVCDKKFHQKAHLAEHSRIHEGIKPFQCTECQKCFTTKSQLVRHMPHHTGKRFACQHCDKSFLVRTTLNQHIKLHSNDPISCPECNKVFSTKSYLKIHLLHHVNTEQTFHCQICQKTFYTKESCCQHGLVVHTQQKPDVKQLKCSKCDITFLWKNSYVKHMKRKHACEEIEDSVDTEPSNTEETPIKQIVSKNYEAMDCITGNEREVTDLFLGSEVFIKAEVTCNILDSTDLDEKAVNPTENDINDQEDTLESKHTPMQDCSIVQTQQKTDTKKFECSKCDLTFSWKNSLVKHMKRKHPCEAREDGIDTDPRGKGETAVENDIMSYVEVDCIIESEKERTDVFSGNEIFIKEEVTANNILDDSTFVDGKETNPTENDVCEEGSLETKANPFQELENPENQVYIKEENCRSITDEEIDYVSC